jgi:hypothetical protein
MGSGVCAGLLGGRRGRWTGSGSRKAVVHWCVERGGGRREGNGWGGDGSDGMLGFLPFYSPNIFLVVVTPPIR